MKSAQRALSMGLLLIAAPLSGQGARPPVQAPKAPPKTQQAKSCQYALDYASFMSVENNGTYLSGPVRVSCVGQKVTLDADSIQGLNNFDHLTAAGHVKYVDDKYEILADTLIRFINPETIWLRGNVKITDRKTGSTLVGPHVDYLRAVPGSKDSNRVTALRRPTATLRSQSNAKVQPSPYIVTAERLIGWGNDKISAYGTVTIQRDSLRASGDSLHYLTGKIKSTRIFGPPAVVTRMGKDTVEIRGNDILLGFADDEKLRDIRANGNASLDRDKATVSGDTVVIGLKGDTVSSIVAWDRLKRARLHREGYDAYGDSLVVQSRDGKISGLQLIGRGTLFQPLDTLVKLAPGDTTALERDWLSGPLVVINFRQVDSSGTGLTLVDKVTATKGKEKAQGCSYSTTRPNTSGASNTPAEAATINYACADKIVVLMKPGLSRDVADVAMIEHVNGLQLGPKRP